MKGAGLWLVIILMLAGGAGFGLMQLKGQAEKATYDAKLAALKMAAQTKASAVMHLDAETYKRDIGSLLKDYFVGLDGLAKELPGQYDIEREVKIGEEKKKAGALDEAKEQGRAERIELALALYKKMQAGEYRPLFTAQDKGFRFDIYDVAKVQGGEPGIRLSFVHWGIAGEMTYGNIDGTLRPPEPTEEEKKKAKKGEELAQVIKIEASGPPVLQFDPSRWVAEFLPGTEIGYYDLPQLPAEADRMDLGFDYKIRTVGGSDLPVSIKFTDMPIAQSWKVGAGEKWDAEERTATDEELQAAGVKPAAAK